MFTIPSKDTKKFSQPNYGDTQGNLWSSFNLNLTANTGRVQTTRTEIVFDETDDADLDNNNAFAFYDPTSGGTDPVFVAYNDKIFFGGEEPIDTFTQDALTNTPNGNGARDDLKVFNDRLYATEATKLKRIDHGDAAWTDVTTLTTGGIHQMCVFANRLYYIDEGSKVFSMDSAEAAVTSGSYTIDFSTWGGHISWIKEGVNRIWIGLTKNDGTRGVIFEWDGATENVPTANYFIEAQGSAGCTIWNDIPYVMDIEGRLLGFNGANFEEVARLPILQYNVLNRDYATTNGQKIIHYNGIQFINDEILMLVNNTNTGTIGEQETYPSGIYSYTKENGLIHKFSPSLTKFGSATSDYGCSLVTTTGAIFDATVHKSNVSDIYASVMFGAEIKDNANANLNAIFIDTFNPADTDEEHLQSGYFVTPWLETSSVIDVWQKIVIKYRKFIGAGAKIVVKYRTDKDIPTVFQNITWDSDSAFTDTSAGLVNIAIGDEIEVLNGTGAGKVAHVLTNTFSTPNYTLTFDDTFPGVTAGDISDVRFQTWKKLPPITDTTVQFKELILPNLNKDTEIQFKVVMEWLGNENEIRETTVINKTEQHAK